MAITLYCWRCDMEIPMLDEQEWELVSPLLGESISDVQEYRAVHGVSLKEARDQALGRSALQKYYELTGFKETNINAVWHHRASDFGPPCSNCGKPLRTPRASYCAMCGTNRK